MEMIELPEVIVRTYFHYLGECKAFLKIPGNNNHNREKMERLSLIKNKNLCLSTALFRE